MFVRITLEPRGSEFRSRALGRAVVRRRIWGVPSPVLPGAGYKYMCYSLSFFSSSSNKSKHTVPLCVPLPGMPSLGGMQDMQLESNN